MSRLIVVTTPDIAPGYRLAGTAVITATTAEEAAAALTSLVDEQGERGVIAMHEPFHRALDQTLRRRFDESIEPLVVPLPSGEPSGGEDTRRERLMRMLFQAVGYEITLDAEGKTR